MIQTRSIGMAESVSLRTSDTLETHLVAVLKVHWAASGGNWTRFLTIVNEDYLQAVIIEILCIVVLLAVIRMLIH